LSPDGSYLIYFAITGKWGAESQGAYTAISRAPQDVRVGDIVGMGEDKGGVVVCDIGSGGLPDAPAYRANQAGLHLSPRRHNTESAAVTAQGAQ